MAGKRHHYIPRFLLAGFSNRKSARESYCFVYKKGAEAYESNIKNVAVEGYFYGSAEQTDVDDLITDEEGDFALLVNQLRTTKNTQIFEYQGQDLERLVIHISVRTRHLRRTFSEAGEALVGEISSSLSTPGNIKKFLLNTIISRPEIFREEIEKELVRRGVTNQFDDHQKEKLTDILLGQLPSLVEILPDKNFNYIDEYFEMARSSMPKTSKSGHIKALAKGTTPTARLDQLAGFTWYIKVMGQHSVILGDVGPWVLREKNEMPAPLSLPSDGFDAVILPISHSHVIYGTRSGEPMEIDLHTINRYSASLSREYFVCSRKTEKNNSLSMLVGSMATKAINEAVEKATKEMHERWNN